MNAQSVAASSLRLAFLTEERCPLGLDDPSDFCLATGGAGFAGAIVDAVFVLIASFAVDRIAIRSIGQC